jgi:replicative DNA helicase
MAATQGRGATDGHGRGLPHAPPSPAQDQKNELFVPPHSKQAEEAVLGSILKRGLAIADVATYLKPQHFYDARHRYIYAAMAALFDRAIPIDYHTIAEELTHQDTYDTAGGLAYLSELSLATPSAAHIDHYARIVLEHAVRRRYISAGQQVAELAWNRRLRRPNLTHARLHLAIAVIGAQANFGPRAPRAP